MHYKFIPTRIRTYDFWTTNRTSSPEMLIFTTETSGACLNRGSTLCSVASIMQAKCSSKFASDNSSKGKSNIAKNPLQYAVNMHHLSQFSYLRTASKRFNHTNCYPLYIAAEYLQLFTSIIPATLLSCSSPSCSSTVHDSKYCLNRGLSPHPPHGSHSPSQGSHGWTGISEKWIALYS